MRTVAGAPSWVYFFAGVILLGGCGGHEDASYAKGWNAGYEEGLADGRAEGRSQAEAEHQKRWGLIGLGVGAMAGAALVALATRKYLAGRWRRRLRRKEVERLVGSCKADLDADLHAQVMAIARKKAALQDRLERDKGPLVAAVADRLRPALLRLDTQLLDIAALLQQLRDLRREIVPQGAARSVGNIAKGPGGPGSGRGGAAPIGETLRELQEQRRIEVEKNAENIARCEDQFAGLAAFLDELMMRVGNLKTIEQFDAFERFELEIGQEIDALGAAFERTLARLTREA